MQQPARNPSDICVALDEDIPAAQRERLLGLFSAIRVVDGLSHLHEANVVYTGDAKFDPANAPALRWVQLNTAGIGHLTGSALAKSGVPVANARGAYTPAVAEFAIALLLATARKLRVCHHSQTAKAWIKDIETARGSVLYRKTLAIVGYGSIGRHIGQLAQAMGMRILACKRNPTVHREPPSFQLEGIGDVDGTVPAKWYGVDQIEEMFRATDHVILTLPLTDQTKNLIGARELNALRPHSIFINVGRGAIVDESALVERLRQEHIGGAGLDVFADGQLNPDSELWSTPNTILTPHIASFTAEAPFLAAEVLIDNIQRDLAGETLLNQVDFSAGY